MIGETTPVNKEEETEKANWCLKGGWRRTKVDQIQRRIRNPYLKAFSSTVWIKSAETVKFGTEKVDWQHGKLAA
jgi:hypothetical protein